MKTKIITTCLLFLAVTVVAGSANVPALISAPQKLKLHEGSFQITAKTRVYMDPASTRDGGLFDEASSPGHRLPAQNRRKAFQWRWRSRVTSC